jgi:RNA polymerase sigma-70 factor (ECF subfamily)
MPLDGCRARPTRQSANRRGTFNQECEPTNAAKAGGVEDASRLMERVRAHDADAFEALYDGYHRLVYGLALRVLSDPGAAEDVTQAVFLKIWDSPALFHGGNFGAWIARVTRNRAFDVIRSRSARAEGEFPESLPLDDTAIANVDGARVRDALARLPAEQREPIELGFFGGVTHQEIARQIGLPLGTVKTRIRSGLRRLRNALEGAVSV